MLPGDETLDLEGAILDRKYRLIRVVAEGGFAVVYEAEHLALRVRIAVKVLKAARLASVSSGLLDRLAQEGHTIARLRHADIVQVLDTGVHRGKDLASGVPYIVLEWLVGETLKQELAASRGSPGRLPSECLALVKPVFSAIAHAHAEGIAHRDIKPSNILLARTTRGVSAKVLDFGIAKIMEVGAAPDSDGATDTSQRVFSRSHAAPEQFAGAPTGPWTDLHALALLLSELLTNSPPYPSEDGVELAQLALAKARPTPSRFGVQVGPWEPIIEQGLSLRAQDRQPSVQELWRELENTVDEADARYAANERRLSARSRSQIVAASAGGTSATYSRESEQAAARPNSGRRLGWPLASSVLALTCVVWFRGGAPLAVAPNVHEPREPPTRFSGVATSTVSAPQPAPPTAQSSAATSLERVPRTRPRKLPSSSPSSESSAKARPPLAYQLE